MPYVPGAGVHGVVHIADVYKSNNVFVNNINVALWNSPGGGDSFALNALLDIVNSPEYEQEKETQEAVEGETENEYAVVKEQKRLVESGTLNQESLNQGNGAGANPAASDSTPGTANTGTVTTSTELASVVDDTLLYESLPRTSIVDPPGPTGTGITYYVKTVTKVPGVVFPYDVATIAPQNGIAVQDVVDNLRALVVNCFDPIKKQYPNAFMTCSFRKGGVGSPTSQHPRGMACDIQFANTPKSEYYNIAQWIRDSSGIAYDQLLLEYKTTGTKNPWIHISFNRAGNRGVVYTFMNDKNCKGPGVQGLFDLSNA